MALGNNITTTNRKALNDALDAIQASIPSTPVENFSIYRAIINQSGTNAPTIVQVIENGFGYTPTFTYDSTGVYFMNVSDFASGGYINYRIYGQDFPYSVGIEGGDPGELTVRCFSNYAATTPSNNILSYVILEIITAYI